MVGTPFVCEVDQKDRFVVGRQIAILTLDDGSLIRNWKTNPDDASHIFCAVCGTEYVWDAKAQKYVKV